MGATVLFDMEEERVVDANRNSTWECILPIAFTADVFKFEICFVPEVFDGL